MVLANLSEVEGRVGGMSHCGWEVVCFFFVFFRTEKLFHFEALRSIRDMKSGGYSLPSKMLMVGAARYPLIKDAALLTVNENPPPHTLTLTHLSCIQLCK